MVLSKQFKMKTAFICFLVIALTLTGNKVVEKHPISIESQTERALLEIERERLMNTQRLNQIEQQIKTRYELTHKSLEPASYK